MRLLEELFAFGERDVARPERFGGIYRSDAADLDGAVADQLAADERRKLGERHLKCADDSSFSWQTNSISSSSGIRRCVNLTVKGFVYALESSTVSSSSSVP